MTEALLTVPDVAALLQMTPRHVRLAANKGEIRVARFGKVMRFRPQDITAYVAARVS